MSWLQAVPVVMACIVVFWGPGAVVARCAGARGLPALAIAPAVTMVLLGLAAILASRAGIAWSGVVAAAATGATALVILLMRTVLRRPPAPSAVAPPGAEPTLVAAIVLGVLAQLVPVAIGMRRPGRVLNAWDALFHLSVVQEVRASGVVTPMSVADLVSPSDPSVELYPHAWHAAAALVPQWAGPMVTIDVAGVVPVVLATVLGVAALTRAVLPDVAVAVTLAPVLAASGVAVPLAIALQPGLVPNALALGLVPGVLACIVDACRRPTWGALALGVAGAVGIVLVHPNACLSLLVLSAPWVVPVLARSVPRLARGWHGRFVLVAVAAACISVVAGVVTSSTAREVAEIQQKPPQPYTELATRLVTGNLGEWTSYPVLLMVVALVGAVTLVRQRRGRAAVVVVALAAALYASAASPIDAVSSLTSLWYTETRRIAPILGMVLVPLAALGLVHTARAAAERVELPRGWSIVGARRLLGGLFLVLTVGLGPLTLYGLADDSFSQAVLEDPGPFDRVPYLTEAEEEMLATVDGLLDPDALLLGSSLSGAGHLAALTGQRVNQPYHTTDLSPQEVYVSEHLEDLATDALVCENVRALGARAVYVDPFPLHSTYWRETVRHGFTTAPRDGAVLARGGDAAIFSLDECYPSRSGR